MNIEEKLTILNGDAEAMLRKLPDGCIQTCITSPPYFGLRDYGVDGQIGLETTPAEFIARLVAVFREVRRVLRDDGTLWVNMGDSYANDGKWGGHTGEKHARALHGSPVGRNKKYTGFKPKDMMGMPWRLAFALQDDGWYLRQDIIWAKPNPMPESVVDRCTKSHEYLFLLSKQPRYYYDADAIKEPVSGGAHARKPGNKTHRHTQAYLDGDEMHRTKSGLVAYADRVKSQRMPTGWALGEGAHDTLLHNQGERVGRRVGPGQNPGGEKRAKAGSGIKYNDSFAEDIGDMVDNRNKRSVWTVPTYAMKEAHFATFPPDLIAPCVLAGSKPGDLVLDPFGGSGTTALVSLGYGRRAVLCELNPEYVAMIDQRCAASLAQGTLI